MNFFYSGVTLVGGLTLSLLKPNGDRGNVVIGEFPMEEDDDVRKQAPVVAATTSFARNQATNCGATSLQQRLEFAAALDSRREVDPGAAYSRRIPSQRESLTTTVSTGPAAVPFGKALPSTSTKRPRGDVKQCSRQRSRKSRLLSEWV